MYKPILQAFECLLVTCKRLLKWLKHLLKILERLSKWLKWAAILLQHLQHMHQFWQVLRSPLPAILLMNQYHGSPIIDRYEEAWRLYEAECELEEMKKAIQAD